jgi:hypothetical protein
LHTRTLIESLGFKVNPGAITDEPPAYFYDFGNLRLEASRLMSRYFQPVFLFMGTLNTGRSIGLVQFEMPLEVESAEQGTAWIAHGIGEHFHPLRPTPWLSNGHLWKSTLPWVRRDMAYKGRPRCTVQRDWFKVAAKRLRMLADGAAPDVLARLSFSGEVLRGSIENEVVLVQAIGNAWENQYAILACQLDQLPSRLNDEVHIDVWEHRLRIGNRSWSLVTLPAPPSSEL